MPYMIIKPGDFVDVTVVADITGTKRRRPGNQWVRMNLLRVVQLKRGALPKVKSIWYATIDIY